MERLLASWETATVRGQKRKTKYDGQSVQDGHRLRSKQLHARLAQLHNQSHFKLDTKEVPAPIKVDQTLYMVEDGELEAERLREVAAKVEAKSDDLGDAEVTADGTVKVKQGIKYNVPLPKDGEDLRRRLKPHSTSWTLTSLELPNEPVLQGFAKESWAEHVGFVLDERGSRCRSQVP